jgi:LPS O-antigen subunit length determinant protein (WzzB/FepE family)
MSASTEKSLEDDSFKDEITLRELISVLWGGRILIFCFTTVVAIASIIISLSITNVYTSESVLVNRDKQDSPMSNFSGLASLAGVDLSAQGASLNKVMGIIESREFVKHLITFDNVLPSLMAAQSYNANTREIIFDDEIYNHETKSWVRDAPANRGVVPSYIEAHKEYSEMISMTKDRLTGHVSLKVEHVSPIFAKEFLSLVINEANNVQRNIDVDSSTKALLYLRDQLSRTPQVEIRDSISKLIENQLETQMMASIHDDYVLMTLEPPFIPERKSGPIRSLIVILSTLVGGLLSAGIVLVREYF